MLQPPTSYQGAKNRLADKIASILLEKATDTTIFYDLCCGSGAVALELLNRGVPPSSIVMCDAGPWGLFWKEVGTGNFNLDVLRKMIGELPTDLHQIKPHVEELAKRNPSIDTSQTFLLLQAASFGSKPIWIENNAWKNCSFRSYWLPTETSNRRSPVNPMMPSPSTLQNRVEKLVTKAKGISGIHGDIRSVLPPSGSIVYIDPPYEGTTPYGHSIDVVSYATSLKTTCFVSEGKPLSQTATLLATSENRRKGGISGNKKIEPNEEWISVFNFA